jgi:hypothetical protein
MIQVHPDDSEAHMILVHLTKSWPRSSPAAATAADVTLGEWALISDAAADEHGDVVLGIHQTRSSRRTTSTGWTRDPATAASPLRLPSANWRTWSAGRTPVRPGYKGQARPVQYLSTKAYPQRDVQPEVLHDGAVQRAVIAATPSPSTPTATPRC